LLDVLSPSWESLDVTLEIAPSPRTTPLLARLGARTHLRLDLGADNRLVDALASLTELPLRDASVDLLVCYHVLEHIPDDRAAMREIARTLSATGVGLVQVPFSAGVPTDEDPDAPVEERLARFGQADHVRQYGDDFEERLVEAGLSLRRVTPQTVLGARMAAWLQLSPDELVWIVRARGEDEAGAVPAPLDLSRVTALSQTLDVLLEELTTARSKLLQHRRRARKLRQRVQTASAERP
jgi:SAM-dependent methyltransferase